MSQIQLIRVDNRLVHGQVGMTWSSALNIDTIVVVDEEVVYNVFSQKLMASIAKAANLDIAFYTIADFVHSFQANQGNKKIFVIVKNIQTVRQLYELGIRFPKINIGNIHYERGRYPLNKKMYLSEADVEDLNYLNAQGNMIFYQDVPGTMTEKIEHLDFEKLKRR
ncbi:PTS sugar transporter subunit IIB [Faecalicoccus pleomorphus]|uniref:PTS sugar transporter subunit IIB n=1 Tax=Faecalicoccus pleomorphus TaxID=1323 RepID=UPI002430642B|nr:PTS sugar transporter subunit IIB [Faecalicoccus pleomorphus]